MASILRVNTLTDASSNNSIATSVLNNGTAKAWVLLTGTGMLVLMIAITLVQVLTNGAGVVIKIILFQVTWVMTTYAVPQLVALLLILLVFLLNDC